MRSFRFYQSLIVLILKQNRLNLAVIPEHKNQFIPSDIWFLSNLLRNMYYFGSLLIRKKFLHLILVLEIIFRKIITSCPSFFVKHTSHSKRPMQHLHLNRSKLRPAHPAAILNHLIKSRSHLHTWIRAISCNNNTQTL